MLDGLVKLIRYMDGLTEAGDLGRIEQLMRQADVTREDMVQACKFNNVSYARNRLAKGAWYELLVICWQKGQSSPIHDHFGSACGVRVVDGVATETIFEETSPGRVRPVRTQKMSSGEVCVTSDTDIHLITNDEPQTDLVTLHLYSPPLNMHYYELDEEFASS